MPTIRPRNDIQKAALQSNCDYIVLAGSVKGGKTFVASWFPAYRIKHNIGKSSMFLRVNDRNFKDPGGFFDKFKEIYSLKVNNESAAAQNKKDDAQRSAKIGTLTTSMPAIARFINGYECHFKSVYRFDKQTLQSLFKTNETDLLVFDECEDFPWEVITYAQTRLRGRDNSVNRQVVMVQNPERECFIRRICGSGANGGGWIGDDGYVNKDMNGKVRYFFNPEGSESEFYWGDTPEEVYSQCKERLDAMIGVFENATWRDAIKTFVFFDLPILDDDTAYLGRLIGSSAFASVADVNWNYSKFDADGLSASERELNASEVSSAFKEPAASGFSKLFMTVDAAGTAEDDLNNVGGNTQRRSDNMTCAYWGLNQHGLHCIDLESWKRPHITEVKRNIRSFRDKHNLIDSQIIIDMQGMGALLMDDFPRAYKSNAANKISNRGESTYANAKSEHIGMMCKCFHSGIITFNPKLISQSYEHTRIANGTTVLHQMMFESKAFVFNVRKDGKKEIIPKKEMKKYIKGFSPDIFDNVIMAVGAHIYDIYRLLSEQPNNNLKKSVSDDNEPFSTSLRYRSNGKISNFSKKLNKIASW